MSTNLQMDRQEVENLEQLGIDGCLLTMRAKSVDRMMRKADKDSIVDILVHGAKSDPDLYAHALAYASMAPRLRPYLALVEELIDATRQPGEPDEELDEISSKYAKLTSRNVTSKSVEAIFSDLLGETSGESDADREALARYALRRLAHILENLLYVYNDRRPDYVQRIEEALNQVVKLHIAACLRAKIEPGDLAAFIVELQLAHEIDFSDKLLDSYAELLGAEGLRVYQKELETVCLGEKKKFEASYYDLFEDLEDSEAVEEEDDDDDEDEEEESGLDELLDDDDDELEEEEDDDDDDEEDEADDDDDELEQEEDDEEEEADPSYFAERLARITQLLDRVVGETRDFSTLAAVLGDKRESADDYVAVADMYLRHQEFAAAIETAESAIQQFGASRCPFELHRLLAEARSKSGDISGELRAMFAYFEAKLTLTSYAALKQTCLAHSDACWKEWQSKAIASLQTKQSATEEERKALKLPSGNTRLLQLHVLDENFDLAWQAAAEGCSVAALLFLSEQSLKQCFDAGLPILESKIDQLVSVNNEIADEQVCLLLDCVKESCRDKADREKLQSILRGIRTKYPLHHKLFKQFKKHRLW